MKTYTREDARVSLLAAERELRHLEKRISAPRDIRIDSRPLDVAYGAAREQHAKLLSSIVLDHGWPRAPKFDDATDTAARYILEVAVPKGREREILKLSRDEGCPPVAVEPSDRSHEGQGVGPDAAVLRGLGG